MVVAPVKIEQEAELRKLLGSMNEIPGRVNPTNPIVPFQQFGHLHFARFVILDDHTLDDIHTAFGLPPTEYPLYLAFLADFDGMPDEFRAEMAGKAAKGLRRIFSCCQGFNGDSDLANWMKDHEIPASTAYVNWLGRTVHQIREENALSAALKLHLRENFQWFQSKTPLQIHEALKKFVQKEISSGRLTLSDSQPTPFSWRLRNFVHLIGVPILLLALVPLLVLYLPFFILQLRTREKRDLEIAPRPSHEHEEELARLEDYDVTNQFTAMGSIKPGVLRSWTLIFILWVLDWSTQHIFIRGHLARVPTIHFARWVFLDQKKRLLFASNYDGSLQSYMDDFINKVGWGLNLVFSNGVGYPNTNWLVLDGAKDEQKFKYFIRRHQLPTEVWYKAYPGLTAFDLRRNTLIRQGIEKSFMPEAEFRQWLALL